MFPRTILLDPLEPEEPVDLLDPLEPEEPVVLLDPLEPEEPVVLLDPLEPEKPPFEPRSLIRADAETVKATPSPSQLDLTPFLTRKGITWEAPPASHVPADYPLRTSGPAVKALNQASPVLVPEPLRKIPTPLAVATELGDLLHLAFHAGEAYIYDSGASLYSHLSRHEVLGLVYRYAHSAIEMDGRPSYPEAIVKCLYGEDRFRIKEFCRTGVVAMKNAVIELPSFRVSPPSPGVLVSTGVNARWDPTAACPVFDSFLESACCGDKVLEARVWQIIGYLLARCTSAKRIFVLSGPTDSGKSVFVKLLSALFYPQGRAVVTRNAKELAKRFRLAALEDAALCLVPDMPNEPLAEPVVGILKSLSGGDVVDDDVKYREGVQFAFLGNLLLTTNHELILAEDDPALQRRFLRLPFLNSIPETGKDRELLPKLMLETDAIATRGLNCFQKLRDNGFVFAGNYERECPVVGTSKRGSEIEWSISEFGHKHMVRQAGSIVYINDAWQKWMDETGHCLPLARFSALLFAAFPELAKEGVHVRKRSPDSKNALSALIGYALI